MTLRQPKGQSTGGQFAQHTRSDDTIALDAAPPRSINPPLRGYHATGGYNLIYRAGNGDAIFMKDGITHRADGPAIIAADGTETYCIDSRIHRTDGPAVDGPRGQRWGIGGRLHRVDGPAVIRHTPRGDQVEYWLDGRRLTEDEHALQTRFLQ